ncbi:MAG TPA: hypothetical protein VI583_00425 [Cyclobacteriaceae bacterium]|nr:hypothetical protein [Cyclobacteriaceae bacterium]
MKNFLKWGILLFLVPGCIHENPPGEFISSDYRSGDGFCLKVGDSILIDHKMIEYYDLSTHMIYLKDNYRFPEVRWNGGIEFTEFAVYADGEEIYQGVFWPAVSSHYPFNTPLIQIGPPVYPEYVVKIEFPAMYDSLGNLNPDPRIDPRIIRTLEKYRQLHEGLSLKIDTVHLLDNNMVYVKITVINRDSFNYYILSPDKMGINLFHYFTNGLLLADINYPYYQYLSHHIQNTEPVPWDYWNTDWLEILYSGEEKSFSWIYEDYDVIQPGNYRAWFQFPGLSHVNIDEIKQENGRIWLGEVLAEMNVSFN